LLVYCMCTRNSGNAGKGTRAIILTPCPSFLFRTTWLLLSVESICI
jgi:hypothetical protein